MPQAALLYKLVPEELPGYDKLKSCRVAEYIPEWKRQEDEKTDAAKTQPIPEFEQPEPQSKAKPSAQKEINPAQNLEYYGQCRRAWD